MRQETQSQKGQSEAGGQVDREGWAMSMSRSNPLRCVSPVAALCVVALGFFVCVACAGVFASSASAGVGWEATSTVFPTDLPPGGQGAFEVNVSNVGDTPSSGPVTVTDVLPEGVTALEAGDIQTGFAEEIGGAGLWDCSGIGTSVVTCTSNLEALPSIPFPFEGAGLPAVMEHIGIAVAVAPGAHGDNRVTVAGGGARGPASFSEPVVVGAQPAGFGFQDADVWYSDAAGEVDTQAGSHPYEVGFSFDFNTAEGAITGGEVRDIEVRLPPGLVGNVTAIPQCTRAELDAEECPLSSQIGVTTVNLGEHGYRFPLHLALPVYNMAPPRGVPAQFVFVILGVEQFLDASVRSGGNYGITVHVDNVAQYGVTGDRVVLWGEPADSSHNIERYNASCKLGGCSSGVASVEPFLTLGTSCAGAQAQAYSASINAWGSRDTAETPFFEDEASGAPAGLTGCQGLAFGPAITISPDTSDADTPAGLTSDVKVNQSGLVAQEGVAPSSVREVTVTLPEGLVLNPGRAAGLQACTPAQSGLGTGEAFGDEGPPSCPLASQVGTVQVSTPLLPDKLEGAVYVLESEPPHVKLEIAASGDGVNLKLPGTVSLNERTGQMVARFPETPPIPFTDFKLAFTGGAQAALATPPGCGVYTTSVDFDPWATPFVADTLGTSSFAVEEGPGGSACASPLPFTPQMIAGATTDQAGGYTDFTMLLTRGEDQQRISKLQFKTPEGLLGMISHVTLCEEPQAAKGECPAASQIGHTVVGAGAGPYPLFVPEPGRSPAPIYIGGPYEGAPYSLVIAVPVLAGPFNLGTTVVRGKIEVDPQTSALTITTDPLPVILDGVPVNMRTIDAVIDRKEFMFNPTNCDPQSFSGTATSVEGTNAALSSPFQVGSCRSLGFKPTFKVSTSAKTSRTEGASLHVSLTLPDEGGLSSEANVQRVKVSLPKQLPSPLTTLQKACLEKVFAANPASCPVASQVGQVKVSTPVLPGGLTGTAYFVSHGGAKYPELILVLTGENGVTVQVHGETFISKAGITTATFATVPDVPFSNFELELPKRQYPALTANGNLCKGTLIMPTEMVGQNGLVIDQSTKIAVTGCPKVKKASHKHKQAKKAKKRR
jgi:uncharacterized repeat protein (TIGR01451 family)